MKTLSRVISALLMVLALSPRAGARELTRYSDVLSAVPNQWLSCLVIWLGPEPNAEQISVTIYRTTAGAAITTHVCAVGTLRAGAQCQVGAEETGPHYCAVAAPSGAHNRADATFRIFSLRPGVGVRRIVPVNRAVPPLGAVVGVRPRHRPSTTRPPD